MGAHDSDPGEENDGETLARFLPPPGRPRSIRAITPHPAVFDESYAFGALPPHQHWPHHHLIRSWSACRALGRLAAAWSGPRPGRAWRSCRPPAGTRSRSSCAARGFVVVNCNRSTRRAARAPGRTPARPAILSGDLRARPCVGNRAHGRQEGITTQVGDCWASPARCEFLVRVRSFARVEPARVYRLRDVWRRLCMLCDPRWTGDIAFLQYTAAHRVSKAACSPTQHASPTCCRQGLVGGNLRNGEEVSSPPAPVPIFALP